jgi:hypothetical protein
MTAAMSTTRPLLQEDTILRVHTATDGNVWSLAGSGAPQDSGTFGEFITSTALNSATNVRVVGMRRNTQLALAMHQRVLEQRIEVLQIGSPLIGQTRRERDTPAEMLLRMRQTHGGLASSLGGWHDFTTSDFVSYRLAACLSQSQGVMTDEITQLLAAHPAWPWLRFIPHLDALATAQLLAEILDPRWFVDQARPESPSKLRAFLGLRATDLSKAIAGDASTETLQRCRYTLDAWQGTGPEPRAATQPGYFLWRKMFTIEDGQRAAQRVSQDFVTFLRLTWMDAIMRDSGRATDWLFSPQLFFGGDLDGTLFLQHRERLVRG